MIAANSYTYTDRCQWLLDFVDLEAATGIEGARWEPFQLAHLNDDSPLRIEVKARQIAWSWLSAAEGLADAILTGTSSIFVSINQDEAKEKIRYARQIYDASLAYCRAGRFRLPAITTENQLELGLDNGARLISMPSRAPRGKAGMNVYLDEFAHVARDRQIYQGALYVIAKGGRMRIGSSPMGASGMFWEIDTEAMQSFPGYTRARTPWWEVKSFCIDTRTARREAPLMSTLERVTRFGNARLQLLYSNSLLEDFQQEMEASYVDETTAWITWDEIRANQDDGLLSALARVQGGDIAPATDAIDTLADWVHLGTAESSFAAGVDVGRTRNTTEIMLVGMTTTDTYPLRLGISMDNSDFDAQYDVLCRVITSLPVTRMLIDRNGLGMQLAEAMSKRFPSKAEGVLFTNPNKQLWASDAKMFMQQHKTPLPTDRDLAYQIHSIKKMVTAARNNVFDTERNEKHHADKFWSWALALAAANVPTRIEYVKDFWS